MRRFGRFTGIAMVAVLALSLTASVAGAAPLGASGDRDGVRNFDGAGLGIGNGPAYGFVDANEDGVNDRFVDANGDGQCDNVGQALGAAYGRTANAANGGRQMGRGMQDGSGTMQRGRGPQAAGANFVDANGNGICGPDRSAVAPVPGFPEERRGKPRRSSLCYPGEDNTAPQRQTPDQTSGQVSANLP